MIAQVRAFAWMRWRLLVNGVRGAKRRDTLEQISRVIAMIGPAAIVIASSGSVIGLSIGGWLAGHALARGGGDADVAAIVIRVILVVQVVMVTLMPLGLSAQSAARNTRLLLLPISRRLLHAIEVVSGMADPWIFAVIPGLIVLVVALMVTGAWTVALVTAVAAAGLIALLVSLGALVSFLAAWLMRDRRRAEFATIAFVLFVSMAGVLPQLLVQDRMREERDDRDAARPTREFSAATFDAALPAWTRVLPSEMAGRAIMFAAHGEHGRAWSWVAGVWTGAVIVFLASGVVHQRVLDAGDSRARRRAGAELAGLGRLTFVPPAVSAVALAQWRTGMRSVRGRLALFLPGPVAAVLAMVMMRAPEDAPWIARIPEFTHLVLGAGMLMVLLSLQPFTMNQFTSDRAGLTLQFLQPVSVRDLVWGKALGTFGMYLFAAAVTLVVTALATGGGSPWLWAAVTIGGASTFLTVSPVAAAMSAIFPVSADLSKTGSGGNPHTVTVFIGLFCTALASVPSALIVLVAPNWSHGLALALSALWLVIVAAIVIPTLTVVSGLVTARRENLFLTIRA